MFHWQYIHCKSVDVRMQTEHLNWKCMQRGVRKCELYMGGESAEVFLNGNDAFFFVDHSFSAAVYW